VHRRLVVHFALLRKQNMSKEKAQPHVFLRFCEPKM
jgi:hypothetical protein